MRAPMVNEGDAGGFRSTSWSINVYELDANLRASLWYCPIDVHALVFESFAGLCVFFLLSGHDWKY